MTWAILPPGTLHAPCARDSWQNVRIRGVVVSVVTSSLFPAFSFSSCSFFATPELLLPGRARQRPAACCCRRPGALACRAADRPRRDCLAAAPGAPSCVVLAISERACPVSRAHDRPETSAVRTSALRAGLACAGVARTSSPAHAGGTLRPRWCAWASAPRRWRVVPGAPPARAALVRP